MPSKTDKHHGLRPRLPGRLVGDEALAARIAGNDEAAFDEVFRRYHQPIYRFCAAMVGPEEAKDVLQNVMVKVMTVMPDGEDFHLKAWLYRVAHNECVDHIRRSGRSTGEIEMDSFPAATRRGDPHRTVEQRQLLSRLVSDLSELPEKQRSALVMRELSGLSYAEMAAGLGSTESAAKQLVYEARLALQQQELGRQLDCAGVRQLISAQDRRRLRGRAVRSHLRECEPCRDLDRAISDRRVGMRSICPPLPAAMAAGVLGAVKGTGAGFAAGGAVAGAAGGAIGGGGLAASGATAGGGLAAGGAVSAMAVKGLAVVLATGAIGAGVVGMTGGGGDGGNAPPAAIQSGSASAPGASGGPDPVSLDSSRSARADRTGAAPHGSAGRGAGSRDSVKASHRSGTPPAGSAHATRLTPGNGAGVGPARLPVASDRGQSRAHEASSTVPGQTGAPPPSRKPAVPPGQSAGSGGPPPDAAGTVTGGGPPGGTPPGQVKKATGKPAG